MRIYHDCPSPAALHLSRRSAPSHTHGACWTPAKLTPHDCPYIVDNGAFTGEFDPEEWRGLLDDVRERMPLPPDFVILPDVLGDAEATLARHREHVDAVRYRDLTPAPVLQPGADETAQINRYAELVPEATTLFVGGSTAWKRAHGREIVREAHARDLRIHVGGPTGRDGLLWWASVGADSVDTSSIVQQQDWERLCALEQLMCPLLTAPPVMRPSDDRQGKLTDF